MHVPCDGSESDMRRVGRLCQQDARRVARCHFGSRKHAGSVLFCNSGLRPGGQGKVPRSRQTLLSTRLLFEIFISQSQSQSESHSHTFIMSLIMYHDS